MNEFIVWDEIEKKFYNNVDSFYDDNENYKCVLLDGKVHIHHYYSEYEESLFYPYKTENVLNALWDIGLNDINDKKIYADCSIVEFTYEGDFKPVTLQGYFSFDDELLCYKINLLPKLDYGVNKLFYFEAKFKYRISGIKIIDTIQENKLGLTDGINL